ncbi:DUF3987 domain-containing protein [uncultured Arthrobacter sp.]|uniref:DUF3987 domain-containing protein n=1 Tax=uncultured Arthrobacter sp. TaxID=114050 RepID=UPI003217CDA6
MSQDEFLSFLWDGIEGIAVVALMDGQGNPSNQRFFQWPDQKPQLLEYTAKQAATDTYTSPSLFKVTNARKRSAKAIQVVHADADTFNIEDALLEPSGIVQTSPGKSHLYWLIEDCHDPALIEPLAHSVSLAHDKATTGLDVGWAVNKLLRVPHTSNTKYDTPFEVTYELTGLTYTIAEFAAAYPPVEQAVNQFKEMGTLPKMGTALKSLKSSPELMQLLNKTNAGNVDRSDALFLLENTLFRAGASDEAAFVICQSHPYNKFEADGKHNADELLWADILRARSKSELGDAEETEDYEVTATIEPSVKDKSVDFLTRDEKASLKSTFISDYVAWASTKTDAAQEYHVAAALMILSTVFSDFGHAVPKFGRLPLNLWFMVLGETTRSRKSTTRALGMSFIKALTVVPDPDDEDAIEYHYDLGSDFTPEALDNELLKRPNRSALLHRDEAQGWIQEMDKKAYMAGAKGKMTELYDGHVSGKLRATGDQNRRGSVDVSLTLFLMGIASQVADYLTQDDFRSGFLTRFIYIEAAPPPRSAKSDYLEQADIREVKQGDEVFTAMVKRIETARTHWEGFTPSVDAPTVPVPCVPEAWERLNRFITDVLDAAEGHQRHQIIEAASDRLTKSILKTATLLAMLDCCDEVQVEHMLVAINYSSSWFGHMVNMANRISESNWARAQAQVEEFLLLKGGTVKWEMVYRHFRTEMRADEFLKIIQALTDAGMIAVYPDEKNKAVRWIELLNVEQELAA